MWTDYWINVNITHVQHVVEVMLSGYKYEVLKKWSHSLFSPLFHIRRINQIYNIQINSRTFITLVILGSCECWLWCCYQVTGRRVYKIWPDIASEVICVFVIWYLQVNKQIVSLLIWWVLLVLASVLVFMVLSLNWTLDRQVEYCDTDTRPASGVLWHWY